MLTENQKHSLENYIYKILKESMFEGGHKFGGKDKKKHDSFEKNNGSDQKISDEFTTDKKYMKQSYFAEKLYPNISADAARSKFSKKVRHAENDNGSEYHFNSKEVHKINNLMDNN